MYIIVVYDIKNNRSNEFKKFCRSFLIHTQKSVFEGEISDSNFNVFISGLKSLMDEESFLKVFIIKNKKNLEFLELGNVDKNFNVLV